jgi:hypothetical protein
MKKILKELDKSNIELGNSLWAIRSSITVYSVIALNASKIENGKGFFGFVQGQQIELIAVGFSKVFEKEKNYRLNSILSIIQFIKKNNIDPTNPRALSNYLAHWKIDKGESWVLDLEVLLKNQYTKYKKEILRIKEARDKHIAHSQAGVPKKDLPSIAVFEELLGIAFGFHNFVNSAFLNVSSHPILTDTHVQTNLVKLLREIGLSDVTTEFQD